MTWWGWVFVVVVAYLVGYACFEAWRERRRNRSLPSDTDKETQ